MTVAVFCSLDASGFAQGPRTTAQTKRFYFFQPQQLTKLTLHQLPHLRAIPEIEKSCSFAKMQPVRSSMREPTPRGGLESRVHRCATSDRRHSGSCSLPGGGKRESIPFAAREYSRDSVCVVPRSLNPIVSLPKKQPRAACWNDALRVASRSYL